MSIGSGAQEKDGGRAGRPGTERGTENAARSDCGAKQLRFKEFGHEVRNGHGAPAEKIEDAGFAEAAYSAAGLQEIPEIFWSGLIDRGRSDGSELREKAGGFCERFGDVRAKRPECMRESGCAETGMKFLSDGAAANHFATLEDERLEAALGEIKSGDESV